MTKLNTKKSEVKFYGDYGIVNRSSAIFYFIKNKKIKTIISFMNYWFVKRQLQINGFINIRKMNGELYTTKEINFDSNNVYNYAGADLENDFEGSVEVEILSQKNLFIPYAAVMAIYKTEKSISMTHSYSRAYSEKEINEENTITNGAEGCWVLRDNEKVQSFCVFHNGNKELINSEIKINLTNHAGVNKFKKITFEKIKPFQTIKLYLNKYIDDLNSFLEGKEGSGTIEYNLGNSFTRMLIGNETLDEKEIQTAHSNFDYSKKDPGQLESNGTKALMLLPDFGIGNEKVIIYPNYAPGHYTLSNTEIKLEIGNKHRKLHFFKCNNSFLEINRDDKKLPNRFVTGFECSLNNGNILPVEVSRGVRHINEPPKRFWWGPCCSDIMGGSKILITSYRQFCELIPEECKALFTFYSAKTKKTIKKEYFKFPVDKFYKGLSPEEIVGFSLDDFFGAQIGYFTFFSEFNSFDVLTMIKGNKGSLSLEHCF